jgi:hypothetical protein
MAWKKVDFDPFAAQGGNPPLTQPEPASPPSANAGQGWWSGVKSAFTGEGRTEFPEAQEFGPAYFNRGPGADGKVPMATGATSIMQSAITPDEEAQFDILKKAIPGLERKQDAHGNIMLKAPGMADFAYLNKPGLSTRDLDEFGTQTLATAPLLGWASRGANVASRIARGFGGLTAASVEQDVLAGQAGSEQGIDSERALLSGTLGAAIPAVGATVRALGGAAMETGRRLRSATQAVTDPQGTARREVQHAFRQDARSGSLANTQRSAQAADIPEAAANRQDLRVMDFGGESVAREGRKAANLSPAAKDTLMRVIGDRYQGQADRLSDMFTGRWSLGNSSEIARQQLRDAARNARAPLYNQAFRQGSRGIDSPTLQQLQTSPIFQRAMGRSERTLQDQAAIPGWNTTGMRGQNGQFTLEFWDQVKRNLDDYAGQAFRQGRNSQGAQLTAMARTLREELDDVVPLYRQARGTAQEYFNADDALEAGRNFAKGNFNAQDAQQHFNRLNTQERQLFTEGFADEFVQKIRASTDRSNLLNRIAQSPMERDRLRLALGQGRYDQLDSFLRLEGIMDKMRFAMGNSTTAQQVTDLLKGYGMQVGGTGLGIYGTATGDPTTAILGALMAGGRYAQLRINENVAREVAELLASRDPQVFLQGLQALGRQPISDAIRAFDDLLASSGIAWPVAAQTTVNQSYERERFE